jgi:hypothetical protein
MTHCFVLCYPIHIVAGIRAEKGTVLSVDRPEAGFGEHRRQCCLTSLAVMAGFLLLSMGILEMMRGVGTAASEFAGRGGRVLPAAFVYAFLNTALPEEILFEGFCSKGCRANSASRSQT